MDRDRAGPVWFGFGAILGAIALLLLVAAPPGRCRSCWTPTRGWLRICSWCHQDVSVIPLETIAMLAKLTTSEASQPSERDGRVQPRAHDNPMLATAIYVSGSTALESGQRYIISVEAGRLRFLGPVDVDPSAVAADLDVRRVDATARDGRILITQPGSRSRSVHAFMSVAGATPDGLASAIVEAARSDVRA